MILREKQALFQKFLLVKVFEQQASDLRYNG